MLGGLDYFHEKDIDFSNKILEELFKNKVIFDNERALGPFSFNK